MCGGVGACVQGGLQVGQRLCAVLRHRMLPRHKLAMRFLYCTLLLLCQVHCSLHAQDATMEAQQHMCHVNWATRKAQGYYLESQILR